MTVTGIDTPSIHTGKLLFIVRALPVHRLGGLEHHARDLVVALARMGYRIWILSTEGAVAQHWPEDVQNFIVVRELAGSKRGDYSISFFRKVGLAAKDLAAEIAADFIVPIDLAGIGLRRNAFHVPVVPIIHGTLTTEVPLDRRYWKRLNFRERLNALWKHKSRVFLLPAFNRMLGRADALVVDSEFSALELKRIRRDCANKVHVVPLGLDYDRYPVFNATDVDDGVVECLKICLLSRIQEIKGIRVALEAANELVSAGIHFSMTIGGSGDYKPIAEILIRQWNLEGKVRLVGRVEPKDVPSFFARHDLFLFPDQTQPAFGLASLEAMYYGLPVVASDVGAVPEVVSSNVGWIYETWSVDKLVKLLSHLAGNRNEIEQKSACARSHALNFAAQKMALDFSEVLRGLGKK